MFCRTDGGEEFTTGKGCWLEGEVETHADENEGAYAEGQGCDEDQDADEGMQGRGSSNEGACIWPRIRKNCEQKGMRAQGGG